MCSNIITTIVIPLIIGIIGIFIGAILNYIYSKKLFFETRSSEALKGFVDAFIDAKVFIENYTSNTKDLPNGKIGISLGRNLADSMLGFRGTHRKAVEVFRYYVSREKYNKIKKAYDNYYNPRNHKGSEEIVNILSFGVYNLTRNEIKNMFNRNISGKELALENINKILDAAHE